MISLLKGLDLMPKWDCFVKWGLTLVTAIIVSGMAVCIQWLLLDRKVPIDVHKGDVVLYQKQIDDSWVFVVRWTGTLRRRCGGVSHRWIMDGFRLPLVNIPFPPEPEITELDQEFTWEVPVHVPSYFVSTGHVSGEYRTRFLYGCNPLQERIFPIVDAPPVVRFELPIKTQPATGPGHNLTPPPQTDR